jgi:hypothetical protein
MKSILLAAAVIALVAGAGCSTIDVALPGDSDRVLRGTVNVPSTLPSGTEILIRLVDPEATAVAVPVGREGLPLGDRGRLPAVERVLGEHRQTLEAMTTEPVPFALEYRAHDDELRHGLNLDVRISYSGRVRFRTISAHVVTLASSPFPQLVAVQPLE